MSHTGSARPGGAGPMGRMHVCMLIDPHTSSALPGSISTDIKPPKTVSGIPAADT